MNKLTIVVLEQTHLLRIQSELFPLFIELRDPSEESRFKPDSILVCGKSWRLNLLYFLQCWVCVGACDAAEDLHDAIEKLTRAFHCNDGVIECRRSGIIRDRLDFGALLRHPRFDGGLIVAVMNAIERRRLEGKRARCIERIRRAEN